MPQVHPNTNPTLIESAVDSYLLEHVTAGVVPVDVLLRAYEDLLLQAGRVEAMLVHCAISTADREAFARERMAAGFEDCPQRIRGSKSWTVSKPSRTRRRT